MHQNYSMLKYQIDKNDANLILINTIIDRLDMADCIVYTLNSGSKIKITGKNRIWEDKWAAFYLVQNILMKSVNVNSQDIDKTFSMSKKMQNMYHPNILRFNEYMQIGEDFYFVVDKHHINLAEFIKLRSENDQETSDVRALQIGEQIISGCSQLMKNGLLPNFIPISNILLGRDENIRISISIQINLNYNLKQLKQEDQIIMYNSPEFNDNKGTINQKNIVWMVGIIMYQLLEKRYPFQRTNKKNRYNYQKSIQFKQIKRNQLKKLIQNMLQISTSQRIGLQTCKQVISKLIQQYETNQKRWIIGKMRMNRDQLKAKNLPSYYLLEEKNYIAKGGFGKVYKTDRFAIKQIQLSKMSKKFRQQVFQQPQFMQLFNHKNIVKCYDYFQQKNKYYIVLELCKSSLQQLVSDQKNNKIKQKDALKIMKDILTGYAQLTKKNIVHRDLKQRNILLGSDGNGGECYKLADFGLSKKVDDFQNTMLSTKCGTQQYQSPQFKIKKGKYTSKTQIWSLGIMLFKIILKRHPFPTQTNNYTLKFNKEDEVSQQTRSLLKYMLKQKEQERMSWEQLYNYFKIDYLQKDQQQQNRKLQMFNKNKNHQVKYPSSQNQIQIKKGKQNLSDNQKNNVQPQKKQQRGLNNRSIQKIPEKDSKQLRQQRAKTAKKILGKNQDVNNTSSSQLQKAGYLKFIIMQKMQTIFAKQIRQNIQKYLKRQAFIDNMDIFEKKCIQFVISQLSSTDQASAKKILYKQK